MTKFHCYETAEAHRLPHDPLKAISAPRPICWVSSVDKYGNRNLAPYRFFKLFNSKPPLVMFSSEGPKDNVNNIQETGEFTCNLATMPHSSKLNETSAEVDRDVDGFDLADIELMPSTRISPPRVAGRPAALECWAIDINT